VTLFKIKIIGHVKQSCLKGEADRLNCYDPVPTLLWTDFIAWYSAATQDVWNDWSWCVAVRELAVEVSDMLWAAKSLVSHFRFCQA